MTKKMKFNIELRGRNEAGIHLAVSGCLDAMEIQEFHSTCRQLLKGTGPGQLILDLEELAYVDSSGIGAFMVMKNRVETEGQSLVFKNCNGEVMKVMKLLNLQKLFAFV